MPDQIFMSIITTGLVLALVVWALKALFKDFPFLLPKHDKYSYKEILVNGAKNKDIRKRLLITIGLLAIYRAATYIPLPGIDLSAL